MGKVWVLDSETKGTGAHMTPLEKVLERPPSREKPAPRRPAPERPEPSRQPRRKVADPQRTSTALAPGHVRKKTTGEIGKVKAVDSRAGTATVRWLKSGSTSTVPLSAISTR
jgi:hypothetical protein